MENWAQQLTSQLDEKLQGAKQRDLRFFRIDEFKRNISRVDDFSKSCSVCQKEKLNIAEISLKIDEAVEVPGKSRKEYDRIIGRLSSHMQKTHGFFPPFYFSYLFSFFGMVAGLLLGYFLMKLFPAQDWIMLAAGFVAGLFTGYVWGNRKDSKIRKLNKLM
ncbi:hypothetical protein SAMN05444274_107112 [Mariniphaga anaerophila]|uniref:Uncharacterized protein n=1 Tax=Mariniphaga anaerophila TaxID=1484053 RepID=A0A1M5DI48_9BACT|nr:AtpZ/AtpI family protein [Mariniphaga anaerophila]SHF66677.1 hypothetical protein SAMN05444274_107112 [Mariniphaga anaerophila]